MNRIDFNAKCSTCGRKYKDHSDDEINECVMSWASMYTGNLHELLSLLSKNKLIRKWGQPGQNKKEFALWPVDGGPPMTSTIPTRDFAIFFLSNQNKGILSDDDATRKEKKESFSSKGKEKEDKDDKTEAEHIHIEE